MQFLLALVLFEVIYFTEAQLQTPVMAALVSGPKLVKQGMGNRFASGEQPSDLQPSKSSSELPEVLPRLRVA